MEGNTCISCELNWKVKIDDVFFSKEETVCLAGRRLPLDLPGFVFTVNPLTSGTPFRGQFYLKLV